MGSQDEHRNGRRCGRLRGCKCSRGCHLRLDLFAESWSWEINWTACIGVHCLQVNIRYGKPIFCRSHLINATLTRAWATSFWPTVETDQTVDATRPRLHRKHIGLISR